MSLTHFGVKPRLSYQATNEVITYWELATPRHHQASVSEPGLFIGEGAHPERCAPRGSPQAELVLDLDEGEVQLQVQNVQLDLAEVFGGDCGEGRTVVHYNSLVIWPSTHP